MSVLDSFTEEMLQSELPKRVILERLTHGLEVEKPPQFANLHGFRYDYQNQTVTISYKVAHGLHDDMTVSFMTFRVILEGLGVCIRMQKW